MSNDQPDPEATRLNPLSGEELEALRAAREQRMQSGSMPQRSDDALQQSQQPSAPSTNAPRSDWNFEPPVSGWGEQGQADVSGWGAQQDAAPSGWADPQHQSEVTGWANSTQSVENWDPALLQGQQKSGKPFPIPMPWLIGGIAAVVLLLLIIVLIVAL